MATRRGVLVVGSSNVDTVIYLDRFSSPGETVQATGRSSPAEGRGRIRLSRPREPVPRRRSSPLSGRTVREGCSRRGSRKKGSPCPSPGSAETPGRRSSRWTAAPRTASPACTFLMTHPGFSRLNPSVSRKPKSIEWKCGENSQVRGLPPGVEDQAAGLRPLLDADLLSHTYPPKTLQDFARLAAVAELHTLRMERDFVDDKRTRSILREQRPASGDVQERQRISARFSCTSGF